MRFFSRFLIVSFFLFPSLSLTLISANEMGEKLFFNSTRMTVPFKTGPRKTNGVIGAIFGGVTRFDEIKAKNFAQQELYAQLQTQGLSPKDFRFFEPSRIDLKVEEIESVEAMTARLFGEPKIDSYSEFEGSFIIRLAFLSNEPVAGYDSIAIERAQLVLLKDEKEIANIEPRSVFDFASAILHFFDNDYSNIQREYFYALHNALKANGNIPSDFNLKTENPTFSIVAKFFGKNEKESFSIEQIIIYSAESGSDNEELMKSLKLKGKGRFFSPHFYLNKISPSKSFICNQRLSEIH